MRIAETAVSTVTNTCPRCHRGRFFENNNPYSLKNGLTMRKTCEHCGLRYERETGFFYGAMYVSYAMVSGLFILLFVADALFFNMKAEALFAIFTSMILVVFPVTYRWSRLIWTNFFVKYDEKTARETRSPAGITQEN
jgi:uncharacterized protein (DUF983 family)